MSLQPIDRRFSEWVKGFRAHMGYTQRDLGAAMGVDRVTVARWEGAASYPDSLTRIRLNDLAREEGFDAVPRRWNH